MMKKHNLYTKIFKQLRGYFITPNLTIWKGLRNRLFNKDTPDPFTPLKGLIQEPPAELFDRMLRTHERLTQDKRFFQLNDLAVQPQKESFDNILKQINEIKNSQYGIVRPIHFYKKIIAAAAVIILIITSYFLLNTSEKRNAYQDELVNKVSSKVGDTLSLKDSSDNKMQKIKWVKSMAAKKNKPFYFDATNGLSFYNASINGNVIAIENSDVLYSLVNYPHKLGQYVLRDDKKGNTLRVNSYTNIKISPFMSSIIADLYKVKKNGRATIKSKKAKTKIVRWRKTDVRTFDKKKNKNPLDIIDLGENVY